MRREQGSALPVRATVEGGEVLSEATERLLGTLEGHSGKEVTWVVRGESGDELTVTVRHPKGGVDRASVALP